MYQLMTTDGPITLEKYRYVQEELQHIRATNSTEVLLIESNGSRYVAEYIKVDGEFVRVFVFQPRSDRTAESQGRPYLFDDCQTLTQGM